MVRWFSGWVVAFLWVARLGADVPLPATPKKPVTDEYHGVKVVDPYRWLENRTEPVVKKWVQDQNRYTRASLDKIPQRPAILKRLRELNHSPTTPYEKITYQDGKLFAQSGELVVTLRTADDPDSEKTLVDAVAVLGKKTAIVDFFHVSPDGKKVAVSLSAEGKEDGTVCVFDVATRKKLADQVPDVKSPLGGSLVWKGNSSGFYYTRNPPTGRPPKKDELTQQLIYFHQLGQDSRKDSYIFGKTLSPIADSTLDMSNDDKYLLVSASTGWASDQYAHYLIDTATGKARQIGASADRITSVRFGAGDDLYLLCNHNAPRGRLLRISRTRLDLKEATIVVPQLAGVLQMFLLLDKRLLVVERRDGSTHLRLFTYQGKKLRPVPVQPGFHVKEIVPLDEDELLFLTESFFTPSAWFRYTPGKLLARKTKLFTAYPRVDFSDCEVVRETAVSKDGTKVPITILRKKVTKLDGQNPTLLTGYGGYNLIQDPEFEPGRRLWLEQGGVLAIAHLRGDGDFGDHWHQAGILTQRQNAFDDFAACARHLIDRKYTNPAKLAIEGASNGGTLMGAALTQHPKLFRAVVSHVGAYDMLRQELQTRGFDIPEFGTVKNPKEFKALYAYSPYHKVVDGTAYPAILLTTGENDGRVDPTNTWKFAARLQAATSSKQPVLLWTNSDSGHQLGSGESLANKADVFGFLFQQLGMGSKLNLESKKKMPNADDE